MNIVEQLGALGDEVKRLVDENASLRAQMAEISGPVCALADTLRGWQRSSDSPVRGLTVPLVVASTVPVKELNVGGDVCRTVAPLASESPTEVMLDTVPSPAKPRKTSTPGIVTPEMAERWRASQAQGLSIGTIAKEAGVSWDTVRHHLARKGEAKASITSAKPPELVAEWRKLRGEGVPTGKIAKEAGVSWSTVDKYVGDITVPESEDEAELPPDVVTQREGHCSKCGLLLTATEPGLPPAKDGLCGYWVEEGQGKAA